MIKSESMENKQFDYLDNNNNNDCLIDTFMTIYENSLSYIKFFFKSLWQVLLLTKENLPYTPNEMINSIDILSMNNSADRQELPRNQTNNRRRYRHRLPKSNSQHLSKKNLLSNKTRVTVRSLSNQNFNRTESNPMLINPTNTLGTINSHITVVPVDSSHCQNMTSENINLREELTDALCRRSHEPLTFINRGMCCGHCQPIIFPNVPFHHSSYHIPSMTQSQVLNQEIELSQKSKQSPQMGDASETQSTPYSTSSNIKSPLTESPENEPLSTGTITQNETNEQNYSILSFPEHATSPSQESEGLMVDDNQLKVNAQILVDDSMQNAHEKYQEILRMNTDQNQQNNKLDTVKQIIENQSKLASVSNKLKTEKFSNNHALCQQLCNKLNLSNSNQITEIIHILASNAPHILKEQPSNKTPFINHSKTNKDNENTLCSELLRHPPFKPKRLIYLCPNGSIQILSAIDEHSNENQINNQKQFRLDYPNSALTPVMQQNHILPPNESSLGLVDVDTNFNHMMLTESTSTPQSHSKNEILLDHLIMNNNNSILTFQQQKTLFKYDTLSMCVKKDHQENNDHSKRISQENGPIIKIDLDLNDEIIEENNKNDENSLPEIFLKRIIAPENSITFLTDDKKETVSVRHKKRYNRSRSYMNKKTINLER